MHRTLTCLITCLLAPSALGLSVTSDVVGQIATHQTVDTTIVSDVIAAITPDHITMLDGVTNETPTITDNASPTQSTINTTLQADEATTTQPSASSTSSSSGAGTSTTIPTSNSTPTSATSTQSSVNEPHIESSISHAAADSEMNIPTSTTTSPTPHISTKPAPIIASPALTKRIDIIIQPITTVITHFLDTLTTPFITSLSPRTIARHRPPMSAIHTEASAIAPPSTIVETTNEPMLHASASDPPSTDANDHTTLWLIVIIGTLIIGFILKYIYTLIHPHTK